MSIMVITDRQLVETDIELLTLSEIEQDYEEVLNNSYNFIVLFNTKFLQGSAIKKLKPELFYDMLTDHLKSDYQKVEHNDRVKYINKEDINKL